MIGCFQFNWDTVLRVVMNAVRVAMVVSGTDDYTGRFDNYVKHIAEHKSIGVLESEHPISYVTAWDEA
ncbi:hypothetical protein [Cohnella luojiensis]|uniref:Uncharacterized protein n=1 Tax=Cohnella luojiensis TaxID=652876 RepID=A0A4Y8LY23_9BACL|nr:hypothetical protein [Cohnella luojiensis]TFE26715.1 hypothetical protein E2980_11445 [Cohnella luojiensis]